MEYNDMVRPCGCRSYIVTRDENGRETYHSVPCYCIKEEDN